MDMQEKCCVEGCQRKIYITKHQLCSAHYMRYIRHGDTQVGGKVRTVKRRPKYKGAVESDKKLAAKG
jgi:hypothetical protein